MTQKRGTRKKERVRKSKAKQARLNSKPGAHKSADALSCCNPWRAFIQDDA